MIEGLMHFNEEVVHPLAEDITSRHEDIEMKDAAHIH